MAEPFVVNDRHAINGDEVYDPEDEINLVDEIKQYSIDKEQLVLGDDHVHGGYQLSRTGR